MQADNNPYVVEFAEKITDQVIEVLTAAKILLEAVTQINQGKDLSDPNVTVQLEFVEKTKDFAKAYKTFEKHIKSGNLHHNGTHFLAYFANN